MSRSRMSLQDDPDDPRHGTRNGYDNLGCRCERCTEAWRLYHEQRRRQRGVPTLAEVNEARRRHGTRGRYRAGCRCALCTTAETDYRRDYRRRQKVVSSA